MDAEIEAQKAANRKVVLEMIGDRPEADAKPPDDMIFVCKLNPVTTEEDLETIFCRFGTITACDIVRDKKTGDSLNYAFIGFEGKEAAEEAYLKMNNALVDDRRIKVDFSQSMFHLWKQFRRFGKQGGDSSMKKMADDHGRSGPQGGRVLDGGYVFLKPLTNAFSVADLSALSCFNLTMSAPQCIEQTKQWPTNDVSGYQSTMRRRTICRLSNVWHTGLL